MSSHPHRSQGPLERRQLDIEEVLAAERTASEVVEPVARLWRELADVTERAVTTRSLDDALRAALMTIGRLLAVETVAILVANEAGDELTARMAIGLAEEITLDLGIRSGQGMAGRVLAERRPLVVGDLSTIHVVNPVLRNSGLRSVAAVPMLSDGTPLGVIWAASYESDRFTIVDAELLRVVASRLATALDRVRAFERERAARREAERLAARIARIQRATAELAAARWPDEVADALVRVLDSEPPVWRAVWRVRDDSLELAAASGEAPPGWDATVDLAGDAPLAVAVRSGRAAYAVAGEGPGGVAGGDATSWAALPIVTPRGAVGAVALLAEGSDLFTPDEQLLLALVVAQAGQAFERALLAGAERQAAERASFFAQAAQVLAEARDLAATLERLADLAVTTIGEICLIDVVAEDGRITRMVARHRDPDLQPLVERLRTEFPPDPAGTHPAILAIGSGEATWSEAMPEEFLRATTVSKEHLDLVHTLGFRSYISVPLVASGRVVGSVTCVSTNAPFRSDDLAFTQELARHVSSVVDNARRYESTVRTSQILQSSLLPERLPKLNGATVETRYLTANRGIDVGGDFYDVLALPTRRILFMVGDVAGHDRGAAAQMGHLRSAARALAGAAPSPSALISALRGAWDLLGFERIATAVVGLLDPVVGDLTVASAGHYPPLLVSSTAATFIPLVPGPPLGVDAPACPEWNGVLGHGEILLGYTDGAVDERAAGSEASMAKLAEVAASGVLTPVAVCDRVVAAIASERTDDVALMALAVDTSRA